MAGQVPLCTLSVTALCIGIHVCVALLEVDLGHFSLCAARVIYFGEYYRIVSAALLHGSLMHIGFNMFSFLSIGSALEMTMGTMALIFTISWSIILSGVIYVGAQWAMTQWFTHDIQYVRQHAVGFSGVIFTLALVESYRSTQPTRSVFGMLRVPTRLYPWVLLVVLSVLMQNISFMGHLSGILVGVMHVYGLTKPLMPSTAYFIEMDDFAIVQNNIGRRPNFVRCPQPLPGASGDSQASSALLRQTCGPIFAAIGAARRSVCAIAQSAASRIRGEGSGRGSDIEGSNRDVVEAGRPGMVHV